MKLKLPETWKCMGLAIILSNFGLALQMLDQRTFALIGYLASIVLVILALIKK